MFNAARYKEQHANCVRAMGKISKKKYPTAEDRQEFDALAHQAQQLERVINNGDPLEGLGISLEAQQAAVDSYTGDNRTAGGRYELLRPDQSISEWRLKRGLGSSQGSDRDVNRFWAERMGLEKASIESRALGEDTASGFGAAQAIVPQQWATGFIDIIRPMLVLHNAGVSMLPMEHELLTYPQFLADVAPAYVSENTSMAIDANPQFAPVVFSARGAYTDITLLSREVAEDTNQSGGLPGLLTGVIGAKYARLIDQVGIYGTASNAGNPGLVNETGIIVQSMGTNGAAPVDTTKPSLMAEASRAANAEPTAFVVNPQTYGTFARLNASTYAKYWDWPVDIKQIPWLYSSTLSSTEVQGTSGSVCSSAYLGPWDRMVIGMRIDLQVTVLRERYADFGAIGLQAYMRFSIRTTHPETFVRLNGILTT